MSDFQCPICLQVDIRGEKSLIRLIPFGTNKEVKMIYCELHEEFKQDTDTCFDYDKDELLLGFNPNDIIEEQCKNCSNREVN